MSSNEKQATKPTSGSYEVGHGKPPKHGQFKKGKSGNPKGRPKGAKNAQTYMQEMFATPVTVFKNGKPKKMPFIEIMDHKLKAAVMNGDLKALKFAFDLFVKSSKVSDTAATDQTAFDLTAEDHELITRSNLLQGVK
ncbi:hypothetical protein SAMN02990966_06487 [Rhodospirillales bacterium URHD0017]|nr:hypothetical protein SAMN02990966_06487 [Rhodospirillales bacterium URHD0017]